MLAARGGARTLAACLAFVAVLAAGYDVPRTVSDSEYYQDLAQGKASLVPAPFSQRVLFPDIARTLHAFRLNFRTAFVVIAVVGLVGLFTAIAYLLSDVTIWAIPLLLATPFVILTFREAYLPDRAYAAMLAGFLVLLKNFPQRWWTPLALIPMFATRETTLLVASVLAVLAWRRRDRLMAATTLAATTVGLIIEQIAARAGRPSFFHVGGLTYLVAKLPYNFMKNIVGVPLWTTGSSTTCTPHATWSLPHLLQKGDIHAVGLCTFTPESPLTALAMWLTLFGIAPTVVTLLLYRHRMRRPVWLELAIWSGIIAFAAAPLLGSSVRRLIGYGWPAFILGFAVLLSARLTDRRVIWFFALSFAVAWIPPLVGVFAAGTTSAAIVILLAAPAHVVAAWRLVRTPKILGPAVVPTERVPQPKHVPNAVRADE
jgi:hypothetical protein